jgi:hypothetical protein
MTVDINTVIMPPQIHQRYYIATPSQELAAPSSTKAYEALNVVKPNHTPKRKTIFLKTISIASSRAKIPNKTRKTRHISFAEDTKQFDGLCPDSAVFDFLIQQFFVRRLPVGEMDVLQWTSGCRALLVGMLNRLTDLCIRIYEGLELAQRNRTSFDGTQVLPCGGGSGARLGLVHVPFLCTLHSVVVEALRVRRQVISNVLSNTLAAAHIRGQAN